MTYYHNNHLSNFFDSLFDVACVSNEEKYGCASLDSDIEEAEGGYKINVEVPGVKKEDVSLEFKDGYLTVKVTSRTVNLVEGKPSTRFVQRERFAGTASRNYFVGDIDEKLISANLADGVLSIFVPEEKKEEPATHQIAIN